MIPILDHYVVLLPNAVDEQFLTPAELRQFLIRLLQEYPHLQERSPMALEQQVQRLIDTTCELEISPGQVVQWYAVRLTKS
ncbi:MAG: chlororespiratory reduction protein 7 [Thermostichales cyanobacterium BF4_bins_65]